MSRAIRYGRILLFCLILLTVLPMEGRADSGDAAEFRAGQKNYRTFVTGETVEKSMPEAPFWHKGKFMIPIKSAVEALDMELEYVARERKSIVKTKHHRIYTEAEVKHKKLTTDNLIWIFYFDHDLMHIGYTLGEYFSYYEFDTPPILRKGRVFMAADEIGKLFNYSVDVDSKSNKAIFKKNKDLPPIQDYMNRIEPSHRSPYREMDEEDQRGVGVPEELREKIELFTRMAQYNAEKVTAEQEYFLIAKTIENEERKMYNTKTPNIYHVDFSESMVYIIAEKDLLRVMDHIFAGGISSKERIKGWKEASEIRSNQKVYRIDAIGYASDSEEVPFMGARWNRDPVIENIKKLKKDHYVAKLTFYPTYSGPMHEFTEEDIQMYAKEGIRITDGRLFHYPKEYGRLTYQVTASGEYRILSFEMTKKP